MEKITWTGRMRNEKLQRGKEDWNILHTIKRWKGKRNGHVSRRQCLLKHGIKGKYRGKDRRDGKTREKK